MLLLEDQKTLPYNKGGNLQKPVFSLDWTCQLVFKDQISVPLGEKIAWKMKVLNSPGSPTFRLIK